jgi:uncharacterized membrane protein YdjX (TVP38/TMEM64 family)
MNEGANKRPVTAEPAACSAVDVSATQPVSGGWPGTRIPWVRIAVGMAIVGVLVAAYVLLSKTGALDTLMDGAALRARIVELGVLGPLAVIGLMIGAIVLSPIPSAPIALAAGAAYGHTWGTVYVLIGAEAGALIAFAIARLFALMAIVFISRLLPFISFDVVSYAAGLTPLSLWRFVVATLAGIIPASFLLAHFGAEMVSADTRRIAISVLALGALTLIPIAVKVVMNRRRKQSTKRTGI